MARTESRFKTSIWSNEDFLRRSGRAQRMYWLLSTQANLSLCGVIALTERRWAKSAADETVETVREALQELEEHHYISIDHDTEEVWIRTFVRHDGVGKTEKTRHPAYRQLGAIASPALRQMAARALVAEGPPSTEFEWPEDLQHLAESPDPGSGIGYSVDADIPYFQSENGAGDRPMRGRAPSPVSSLQSLSPSTSPPDPPAAPSNGTGALHRGRGTGTPAAPLDLVHAVEAVCAGRNRSTVRTEAAELVMWAAPLDRRLLEEVIAWFGAQADPPALPRALASVVRKKARDCRIELPPFRASTMRQAQ